MTLLLPLTWSVCLISCVVWYGDVSNKAHMHFLHLKLARKLLQRLEKGRESVGVGHAGRARREKTGVFKSAQQSVLGRGNFEIRASGSILFYFILITRNDFSLMRKSCCSTVVISPPLTRFHAASFLTHFLHLLCLFPSRVVLAPSPSQHLA